ALARSRVTPSALEVRENGEVPERRIHAPETEPAGDELLLPRGVDQEFRFDLAALARAGAPVDTGAPEIGVEGGDLHALADVHAGARGVLEQHRIELGTIDLEGRARSADEALIERVAPRERAILAHELGRVLRQEPALQLRHHPELLEQRHRAGQQGLADVEARERLALAQDDASPTAREQ